MLLSKSAAFPSAFDVPQDSRDNKHGEGGVRLLLESRKLFFRMKGEIILRCT